MIPTNSLLPDIPQHPTPAPQGGASIAASSERIVWWLLTLCAGIAFSVIGAWAMNINHRLDTLDQRTATLEKQYSEIDAKLDIIIRYAFPHALVVPDKR